jgi:hypothetical protein
MENAADPEDIKIAIAKHVDIIAILIKSLKLKGI